MISVPDKVKELLHTDSVKKNIRIHFPNGERTDICNNQIVQDSVSLTESINSRDNIKFGISELPIFECEVVNVSNIEKARIDVYLEVYCDIGQGVQVTFQSDLQAYVYQIPYGKFVVKSCERQTDLLHRKIVAYGLSYQQYFNLDLLAPVFNSKYYQGSYCYNYSLPISLDEIQNASWDTYVQETKSRIFYYNGEPVAKLCYANAGTYDVTPYDNYYQYYDYTENPHDDDYPVLYRDYYNSDSSRRLGYEVYKYTLREYYISDKYFGPPRNFTRTFEGYLKQCERLKYNTIRYIEEIRPDIPAKVKEYIGNLAMPHIEIIETPYFELFEAADGGHYTIDEREFVISDYLYHINPDVKIIPITARNFQTLSFDDVVYWEYFDNNETKTKRKKVYALVHLPSYGMAIRIYKENDPRYPQWRWWLHNYFGEAKELGSLKISECTKKRTYEITRRINISNGGALPQHTYNKLSEREYKRTLSVNAQRTRRDYNANNELISTRTVTRTEYYYSSNDSFDFNIEYYYAAVELWGMVCKYNRYGELETINIIQNFNLTPSNSLYPSNTLRPQNAIGERIGPEDTVSCWYSDKLALPFGAIKVRYTNTNNEVIDHMHYINGFNESSNAEDFQTYEIQDNYFIENEKFTNAEIINILSDIEYALVSLKYIPVEIKNRGLPYLESGDTIEIFTKDNDNIVTILFRRIISGEQCLFDTYEMR